MKIQPVAAPSLAARAVPIRTFAAVLEARAVPTKPVLASPGSGVTKILPSASPKPVPLMRLDLLVARTQARSVAHAIQGRVLQSARQYHASRATETVHARAHATSAETDRSIQPERVARQPRLVLLRALEREVSQAPVEREAPLPPPHLAVAPSTSDAGRVHGSESVSQAAAIAAMVERIEVALKNDQPTLSLALGPRNPVASIEVARTGRNEVAVCVTARGGRGRPLAETVTQLREALIARGLKVRSLVVA